MQKRLWVIIITRLVILLLFSAAAATLSYILSVNLVDSFLAAIGLIGLLSGVYALAAKYNKRYETQAYLQFLVDTLLITWLIYRTGDVASPLSALYLVIILASSGVLGERRVYAIASACALLYGGLASATINGLIGHSAVSFSPGSSTGVEIIYKVVLNIVAFFVVAALSSSLSSRLRGSATQLAKTTQRLSELRAFNERVIDSVSSGLLTTDLEGRIKTFNRAAEEITGFTFASVYDNPVTKLFGDIGDSIDASIRQRNRRARVLRFTTDCRSADGRFLHLGFSASPLMDEDNTITGVVISFQDLTEISKMEREMRRHDRLVALGKMAAGIAHEIRNPLAAMRGAIQVLHGEMAPDSEQAELMQIVLRESDRLNGIVTDFLSYARPQKPVKNQFDLVQLLTETFRLMRHSSEIGETHQITEAYPSHPVMFEGDPNQLRQVCWNLTRNAFQAMPNGGTLTIRLTEESNAVNIEVEDTGQGMNEEQIERVFEPFNSSKVNGTGLGLAIVHQIISDHGGKIEVNSDIGRGTKILIVLPGFTDNSVCEEQEMTLFLPDNNGSAESVIF
ncbi:MAG TPA: ATP-binding protein [Blastocatellia bacterium]|nr:ATP-binding protein [Blastocatellia bacterium]